MKGEEEKEEREWRGGIGRGRGKERRRDILVQKNNEKRVVVEIKVGGKVGKRGRERERVNTFFALLGIPFVFEDSAVLELWRKVIPTNIFSPAIF